MALTKLPKNAITDGAIDSDKIEDGTIQNQELAGSLSEDRLATGTIENASLSNSSITINGTSVSLGGSSSVGVDVNWQSVITADGSTTTTGVAGNGYFIDTTSAAHTFTLPASATLGDQIAIKDYAGTFASNNLTIDRNGHNIQGITNNGLINTNKASLLLVYVDSTKGWIYAEESNVANLEGPRFITATGGTITTSGDFKIHTFTGDGCFIVTLAGGCGPTDGPSTVDYMVIAGGGGGGAGGSGGGAGGFRESHSTPVSGCYSASPLATPTGITLSIQTYPITVGAGGTGAPSQNGTSGSNSVFSTITSAGGGGGRGTNCGAGAGFSGGSGSGGVWSTGSPVSTNRGAGGAGNTPPVSPPQGNSGGGGFDGIASTNNSGGGGGAGATGGNACVGTGGDGGNGVTTSISSSPTAYSGGGGGTTCRNWNDPFCGVQGRGGTGGGGDGNRPGGASPNGDPGASSAGTVNTGGGGGGGAYGSLGGSAGGKGIVIIRYKFQ
jgi:hypothetical protein